MEITEDQKVPIAIGVVAASWNYVEIYVDCLVLGAFKTWGPNSFAKNIPKAFGVKIKYLKKYFERTKTWDDLKTKAFDLLARADALALERNWAVHSFAIESETMSIIQRRVKYHADDLEIETREIPSSQLYMLVFQVHDLAGDFIEFMNEMGATIPHLEDARQFRERLHAVRDSVLQSH